MTRFRLSALLAASSVCSLATSAYAQDAQETRADSASTVNPLEQTVGRDQSGKEGVDIIVTARLKGERILDVPATVVGVTSETLQERNVLNFQELNSIVPGLNLTPGQSVGSDAQVAFRGVQFDAGAQAGNLVDAYIDDAGSNLFQLFNSFYDVGHLEILKGPQATVRGGTAPSGAFGLVTRRPDLSEMGGYISATGGTPRDFNLQGAIGVPLIKDKLGIRFAGVYDRGSAGDIRSANTDKKPFSENKGFRVSVLFRPTDNVEATLIYRHDDSYRETFGPAVFGSGAPAAAFPLLDLAPFPGFYLTIPAFSVPAGFNGPVLERDDDRSVQVDPNTLSIITDSITGQFKFSFAGQQLYYLANKTWTALKATPLSSDPFNVMPGENRGYFNQNFDYYLSHKLQLSSEQPIGGFLDYSVSYSHGGAWLTADYAVDNIFSFNGAYGSPLGVNSPSLRDPDYVVAFDFAQRYRIKTDGLYGYLKAHLGESTEVSVGASKSWTKTEVSSPSSVRPAFMAVPHAGPCTGTLSGFGILGAFTNAPLSASPYPGTCNVQLTQGNGSLSVSNFAFSQNTSPFTWNAAVSHKITPDLVVYANYGTAYRAGPAIVGAPVCDACGPYNFLDDEKSRGWEVGFKGKLLNNRLNFAVAYFRQTFDNFIYQTEVVPYVNPPSATINNSTQFTLNAPMRTQGIDAEVDFRFNDNLQLGAAFAWARSRFRNATVPCRDSNFDGVPDSGVLPTNYAGWLSAGGPASGPALCVTNGPTASTPPWNLILRGEYSHDAFADTRAFLRGTFNYTPKNTNFTLVNPGFVPKSYGLLDLFAGLRSSDRRWEFSVAARNVFNTRTILNESVNPGQFSQFPFSFYGLNTGYRTISRLAERKFQVSLRYAFGSR